METQCFGGFSEHGWLDSAAYHSINTVCRLREREELILAGPTIQRQNEEGSGVVRHGCWTIFIQKKAIEHPIRVTSLQKSYNIYLNFSFLNLTTHSSNIKKEPNVKGIIIDIQHAMMNMLLNSRRQYLVYRKAGKRNWSDWEFIHIPK